MSPAADEKKVLCCEVLAVSTVIYHLRSWEMMMVARKQKNSSVSAEKLMRVVSFTNLISFID